MKPKNFPARKLKRRFDATRDRAVPYTSVELSELELARSIYTKKNRGG